MVDYRDMRVLVREGRHRGTKYTLTVWARADGAKFSLERIEIDGLNPAKPETDWAFDSPDDAFEEGHRRAQYIIGD